MDAGTKALLCAMNGPASYFDITSHIPMLYALARRLSFGRVVECGVGSGFSTLGLLLGCAAEKRELSSYDFVPQTEVDARRTLPNDPEILKWWKFILKKSVQGAADFEDGSVSLFFLDTSHLYEETCAELAAWSPKMHPQGVMCGHDYCPSTPGVKRAVDEFVARQSARRLMVLLYDHGLWILFPD